MAQTYTRQSSFADGDTITAALFNDEYNQLVNAFAYSSSSASSTGHRHDGTAGQGGNIPQIGDLDFLNKIVVDDTNNRWGFYVEVSSAAVEQIRLQDGALLPVTDSDVDLGTSSLYFKDAYIDSITTTGNVAVGGNLTVTGTTTFNGGTLTLGDAADDNVVFGADVNSNIIPNTDNTYDLGSSSQEWKDLYIDGTANIDTLSADTAAIGDLTSGRVVLAGTSGELEDSANLTFDGSTLALTGAATVSTNLTVSGNTTLGNAATDTVTVTADVASNLIPSADSTYSLGDASNYWSHGYIDAITTTGNVSVGGNLTVTGTTTFNGGTLTLGDAADDNVVFGADVNSNIIPNTDNTYDLGSSSQEWKDLYVDGVAYLDEINFNGTAITSTAAELNILDGVTSTAAELNLLDGVTATTAELNILDGVTSTAAELNILDGVTSTAAELNILDGVTSTTAELNILDGVTSTAAELNILDGVTSTATELNILDGDTSATSTTLADADRVVVNDAGTMVQVALTDFETYFESALDTLSNVTTVGALNAGSITSGFGAIDNGSSAITTTGTVTYGSLSDGTITITAFVDEDDMSSNSATLVPTQQSVKAYVDAQILTEDTLAELNDTNITSPSGDALLFYEATSGNWIDNVVSGDITITSGGVATIAATSVENSMLAGSIANAKLANSTVSYGGVSLALGASDATPAFNLSDATAYPGDSSLVTTGALNSGSITSGFGSIDVGSSAITTTGTVTGGTLAGTLSTAAQTNVTSVGTLSSLTVSGDVTVDTSTLKVDSTNNRVGIGNASPDVSLDLGSNTDAIHVPVGNTAARPGSPAAGYFRYNSETEKFEGYTTEWGAIAGGGSGTNMDTNIFTGDGSDTTFTLSTAPDDENNLMVFIDGVFQAQNVYSVSGTTLTFATAPANGRVITVYHSTTTVGGSNNSIATMTGDGSDTTLTLSVAPVHENNVSVYFDGVYQSKSNYSISGTTLTFSTAPPSGVAVEAITATNTSITTATQLSDADGDTLIQTEESSDEDKIRFDTGGTERMIIDSTGVGIGTTSPSAPLHIVGDGNTGQRVHVGTSSAHQIYLGNTGGVSSVGTLSSHDFQVITNGASRLIVSTTNGVGIGTAIDHAYTSYDALEIGHAMSLTGNGGGNDCQIGNNFYLDESGNWSYKHSAEATLLSMGAGNQIFYRAASGTADAHITWVETMRTTSGALGIGTTTPTANNVKRLYLTGGESVMAVRNTSATDASQRVQIEFFDNGGTRRGYISSSNASTVFSTSSDYRLKEVLEPLPNGLDRLNQLKPVKFKWTDSGHIQEGFIAHEAQEVFPDAIGGEKDAVKEDGSLDLQTMDYGRITPLLVKAIQEQQTIIEDLKARIETLEG